eukprot:16438657-Heterocapsa_arctica.AAC.2
MLNCLVGSHKRILGLSCVLTASDPYGKHGWGTKKIPPPPDTRKIYESPLREFPIIIPWGREAIFPLCMRGRGIFGIADGRRKAAGLPPVPGVRSEEAAALQAIRTIYLLSLWSGTNT